mmetsp:Transcript_47881/g.73014  ORF Transcript_47881/g.73014 Transcript_47881/m.73014 type:complete len:131 (-) Transcript_47881:179-571(-)
MTMRISAETIVLIGIVVGFFLLALICLACSLNPRELLDCSILRCCWRRRRNHVDDDAPQTYETLNEFIFESGDEEQEGVVTSMNNEEPTSMQQVFPDLLGGDTGARGNNSNDSTPPVNQSSNTELSEPLL